MQDRSAGVKLPPLRSLSEQIPFFSPSVAPQSCHRPMHSDRFSMAHVTPVASLPGNSLNVLMGGFSFEGQQNQQLQNVAMQNIVNLIQQIIVQKNRLNQLKPFEPNLHVLGAQYGEMAHETFAPISQPSTQDVKPSLGKRSKPEENLIEVSPGGAEPAKRKRVYTKAACVSCRSSHLACDDGQPCRNCTKNGSKCERVEHTKIYVPPTLDEVLGTPSDGESTKSPSPAPSTDSNGARKYVKAACSCCRKSHLACDNYRPCRNCVRLELKCEEIRSQRRSRS